MVNTKIVFASKPLQGCTECLVSTVDDNGSAIIHYAITKGIK